MMPLKNKPHPFKDKKKQILVIKAVLTVSCGFIGICKDAEVKFRVDIKSVMVIFAKVLRVTGIGIEDTG